MAGSVPEWFMYVKPLQLLMASLETASDSLRRQADERDEADAAEQV